MNRLFFALCLACVVSCANPLGKTATSTREIPAAEKPYAPYPFAPDSARIETREGGPGREEINAPTQVVVLGTGTPVPDAYRAGPAIAVIHKAHAYLFDVGAGTVRRAIEARYRHNIPSLYPNQIKAVFITHMHSDHVLDLVELSQTLWWRRPAMLQAYGPAGLRNMAASLIEMMSADIETRLASIQPVPNPEGFKMVVSRIFRKFDFGW